MTQTAPAETAPPRWREVFMGARAGLAGASVALADAGTISIELGLAGAFAIGVVAAMLLALVARRLPYARAA